MIWTLLGDLWLSSYMVHLTQYSRGQANSASLLAGAEFFLHKTDLRFGSRRPWIGQKQLSLFFPALLGDHQIFEQNFTCIITWPPCSLMFPFNFEQNFACNYFGALVMLRSNLSVFQTSFKSLHSPSETDWWPFCVCTTHATATPVRPFW